MKLSHFSIDRPIFASVLSILIMIIGGLSYFSLPIEQYPQVAPPTIQVTATYPGANAEIVSDTVATPIEQEVNGVENMLYMLSQSTGDGQMTLTITFELGTDLDEAQVLVQNRVAIAEARLPEPVRRLGITTRKNSPDLMMVINMFSPDGTYDQTYIGNYAVLQLRDRLRRIEGVGDIQLFGASEYSMRIWLDPDRIQSLGLSAGDVVQALRAQNIQVASGNLNQSPVPQQNAFEISVQTQGRLIDPQQFENVIVKADDTSVVRVRDIGRVELGSQAYVNKGYLGTQPAVAMPVFQRPGTNAIETAQTIIATMEELSADFPQGLAYEIAYNPTEFVQKSIDAVVATLIEAVILVVLVIIVFLQTWRAAIIPILAIPISLIGTFAVMQALGFSLNNLTMFGLVLAIGIVVDDAIVVVENMERNMRQGLDALTAARRTMTEVGGALISMGLVLVAVFLPTTFLEGISGQFYQQFGVTIAVATVISVFTSLTLSPALSAILLKDHSPDEHSGRGGPIQAFFNLFNAMLDKLAKKYGDIICIFVKKSGMVVLVYIGLMLLAAWQFSRVPTGFIPPQDQGYFIVSIQLPPGASLSRTDAVVKEATEQLMDMDAVINTVAFTGFAGATFTNATNAAAIFPVLADFDEREKLGLDYNDVLAEMGRRMAAIEEAFIVVIPPPPVRGMGNAGGFRMMVQDQRGRGLRALEEATWSLAGAANQDPAVTSAFTFFETGTPQLYLDINREKAEQLGVPVANIFEALEVYLGSSFINDFNFLGRTFRVTAQADAPYRLTPDDATRIRVRNERGDMVPIGSVAVPQDIAGPSRVPRYNLYPAAGLLGNAAPGYSTGEALAAMERLADQVLPNGMGFEWTEIALQEKQAGGTAAIAFILAVVFVYLLLAAQYESWTLPLAVILIVPMCLLSAITGVALAGMDNNILTQIGFVVLVALASKNAILIVEFAKQLEDEGRDRWNAAIDAAKLRLRPILMTSFAFILGVVPLVLASGAGAEMRQALGVAVFSGMLGVTFFGLLFTPVFYVLCRQLAALTTRTPSRPLAADGA
ncbi:multidrug efflux RND transporter permease subunit [Exilibacterium tricleocarpae]|uniref:Efflux pump membrane transporter n=1 Tax=Exilibacterium tricleocarpae TaxID=2591008 RepID=A0A545U9B3_9GAMM|nr:multidrug efflux RND transporter permease subunit [Exilibacterium tricleocarpae]TQV86055.1 multidrug efflux RND transporter permease subunit [Exilibacterium tricleocarpae]